jgi:hypothetical protein
MPGKTGANKNKKLAQLRLFLKGVSKLFSKGFVGFLCVVLGIN